MLHLRMRSNNRLVCTSKTLDESLLNALRAHVPTCLACLLAHALPSQSWKKESNSVTPVNACKEGSRQSLLSNYELKDT